MKGLDMQELWQLCAIVDAGPGDPVYVSRTVFRRLEARGLVRGNWSGPHCPDCRRREWHPGSTLLGRWLRRLYATGSIPMVSA